MSATNLTKAFRALRRAGYIARQNFMCCQSLAWRAIPEDSKCVFYHKCDGVRLRNEGVVHLSWAGNGKEIVKLLKDHGLVVVGDGADEERILVLVNPLYPLHWACRGDYELTKLLLEEGADPNKKDNIGGVPLHYCETASITKLLLDAGANVEVDNNWISPLHSAIQNNDLEMVRLLVEAGADIERKHGGAGHSPLAWLRGGGPWSEIRTYLVSILEARQLQATVPHALEEKRVVRL